MAELSSKRSPRSPRLRIADWDFDPESGELQRRGELRHLEPKMAKLLSYLAEQAGRVIDKEELLREVWPDVVVAESSLWRSIAGLRKALGDDHHQPKILETLPRRGYRLIAAARVIADLPVALPPDIRLETHRPAARQIAIGLATLALLTLVAAGIWRHSSSATPPALDEPGESIVGLPAIGTTAPENSALQLYHHGLDYLARRTADDTERALHLFERAIDLDPELAVAHAGLATSRLSRNEVEAALAAAHRSLALDPELAAAHRLIGSVYQYRGWLHRAAAAYGRALQIEPDNGELLNRLAELELRRGRPDRALVRLRAVRIQTAPGGCGGRLQLRLGLLPARQIRRQPTFGC